MNAANLAVDTLYNEGCDVIFGLPGTSEIPIVAATVASEVAYVVCLHEGAAVSMADGYARVADHKLAVANTHATQGTFNALGSLRAARRDRSGLLLLVGAPGQGYALDEPNHFDNSLESVTAAIGKWSWTATRADQVGRAIHRGATLCKTGVPGPTTVLIPQDVLISDTDAVPPASDWRHAAGLGAPSRDALRHLVELFHAARKPVIFAGRDALRTAMSDLRALAEATGAHVVSEALERGPMVQALPFPLRHRLSLGFFERGNEAQQAYLRSSDLVVVLGGRTVYERVVGPWLADARIVHISEVADDLAKSHPTVLGIVASYAETMRELTETLARPVVIPDDEMPAPSELRPLRNDALSPDTAARVIGREISNGSLLVDDSQSFGYFIRREFEFERLSGVVSTLSSHLGWGLPAACGAQLATDRPVVATISDGSWVLSSQAIWTAARYHLPLLVVVIANGGFVSLRQELMRAGVNRDDANRLTTLESASATPDIAGMAVSLGAAGVKVETTQQLAEAITFWRQSPTAMVIELVLPNDESVWNRSWHMPPVRSL